MSSLYSSFCTFLSWGHPFWVVLNTSHSCRRLWTSLYKVYLECSELELDLFEFRSLGCDKSGGGNFRCLPLSREYNLILSSYLNIELIIFHFGSLKDGCTKCVHCYWHLYIFRYRTGTIWITFIKSTELTANYAKHQRCRWRLGWCSLLKPSPLGKLTERCQDKIIGPLGVSTYFRVAHVSFTT